MNGLTRTGFTLPTRLLVLVSGALAASVITSAAIAAEGGAEPPYAPAESCEGGYDGNGDGFVDGTDQGCQTASDTGLAISDAAVAPAARKANTRRSRARRTNLCGGKYSIYWYSNSCPPPAPPPGTTCFNRAPTGGPTSGDDVIVGTVNHDIVNAKGGDDRVCTLPGYDIIYGASGDDMMRGGNDSDLVAGDGGDDVAFGGLATDLVAGGAGVDLVNGQDGSDLVHGGDGDDTVFGGSEDDKLWGGPGFDRCTGNSGADTFYGCELITDGPS